MCIYYPKYELKFGIDHSRIVDLLQVFDISPTIDLPVIGNERLSLKVAAMRDPNSGGYEALNIDFYGIWATKAEIGDRELFLDLEVLFLVGKTPL